MTTLNPDKLLAELRKQGLVVHEIAGDWKTRGHGSLDVHIIGVHDSVTGSMDDSRAAQFGYQGRSDLPGPDYNLIVGGNGEVWLISGVRSWNIGSTNKSRIDMAWAANMPMDRELGAPGPDDYQNGNNVVFGFAFRTEGAGPYTPKQYASGVKACAALGHALGWSASDTAKSCAGHGEVTRRKVDPQFDMGKFRRDVQAAMSGSAPAPATPQAPQEDDVTAKEVWGEQIPNPSWAADKMKSVDMPPAMKPSYKAGEILTGTAANVGYLIGLVNVLRKESAARDAAQTAALNAMATALAAKENMGPDDLKTFLQNAIRDEVVKVQVVNTAGDTEQQ